MRPLERNVRIAAALVLAVGLATAGVAILSEKLGLGAEAARGIFGWKRLTLLVAGAAVAAIGALLLARPRIVAGTFLGRSADLRAALGSARKALIASGALAVAAFIPRAMTAGHFQHVDEVSWMERSDGFAMALLALDFPSASATTGDTVTMPGVTTMWHGTIARGVWNLGRAFGMVDEQGAFAESAIGLHLSQLAVAVTTSALIGLLVLLAWKWAGGITAVTAGALLATEPFLVEHGATLATDELAAMFGVTGTLALLIAFGIPGGGTTRPRTAAAFAGVLLAGAFLSKLSVLILAPGLVLIIAWALARAGARRSSPLPSLVSMRPMLGPLGIVAAAGLVTTLLAWPAVWADPLNQISLLRDSGAMAGQGHPQFFRGEATQTPGALFYLVATPFRMTPWFLVGTGLAIAAAVVQTTRPRLAVLAVIWIPAFVALSLASKQFDRYVLVILPFLALGVGIGIDALWGRLRSRRAVAQVAAGVAGTVIALALAHTMSVAPWGASYFNPLLGGPSAAERTIPIEGRGQQELAGALIREREAPACDVTIAVIPGPGAIPSAYPCGSVVETGPSDYVVIPVYGRQINPHQTEEIRASGRTVGIVRARGIDYAEIVDLRGRPYPGLN
jgi:hypothetical protein